MRMILLNSAAPRFNVVLTLISMASKYRNVSRKVAQRIVKRFGRRCSRDASQEEYEVAHRLECNRAATTSPIKPNSTSLLPELYN